MKTKTITFTLMMGVLGNLLFGVSFMIGNIAPGIAFDFSLLAAFISGFYGGPAVGFVSGIFPGIMFGPYGTGAWLGLIGLPLGKALTGLTVGLISRGLKLGQRPRSSILAVPATLLSYIPECLFTYAYFAYLMPYFLGKGGSFIFLNFVLLKALAEVTIMSFLMAALIGNQGFNEFLNRYFLRPSTTSKSGMSESS